MLPHWLLYELDAWLRFCLWKTWSFVGYIPAAFLYLNNLEVCISLVTSHRDTCRSKEATRTVCLLWIKILRFDIYKIVWCTASKVYGYSDASCLKCLNLCWPSRCTMQDSIPSWNVRKYTAILRLFQPPNSSCICTCTYQHRVPFSTSI